MGPLQGRVVTRRSNPLAELSIESLTVRYGPVIALSDLDLEIASGELFVLLGGSGSGKTTLLRTLGGFIAPTEGRIRLGGEDITRLPPHRRPVNTTFQSYALFPHMTVADNVAFGLHRQRVPKPDIAQRVDALLDLVRLREFAHRKPDALSGGQRQRVALARALAPRPRLLLLDEPLSALDRNLREQTRQELLRIQQQTGTTFVMVTHDQDEALAMATRIGLLHNGRLAQVGTPADLYERPATRYVAAFMGNDNILAATALGPGQIDIEGVGPLQTDNPVPTTPFWIAIRPEPPPFCYDASAQHRRRHHPHRRLFRRFRRLRHPPRRGRHAPNRPAPQRRHRTRPAPARHQDRRHAPARSAHHPFRMSPLSPEIPNRP